MNGFLEFLKNVQTATFNVPDLVVWVRDLVHTNAGADLGGYWTKLMDVLGAVAAYVPLLLAALGLVQCFFGKKLMGLQKFLIFFIVGFGVGQGIIYGLFSPDTFFTKIPAWVYGLIIGLVAGLLSKFLYLIAIAAAGGYVGYYYLYNLTASTFPAEFGWIICAAIVVVALVLVFIFLKYAEMLATAACGAFFTYSGLMGFTAIADAVNGLDWVKWVVLGVLFVLGTFVQIVTRKKY